MPLNEKENKNKNPKVLFYTSIPRAFRTTLIGYLYEIAQAHSLVLLSEEIDSKIKKILADKRLFPNLEKIIAVRQYTGGKKNLLAKNKYLYKLAKDVIRQQKPDVVIAANDIYPFEMYLLRMAKKRGSITICLLPSFFGFNKPEDEVRWYNLMTAQSVKPYFLPFPFKKLLLKTRRYFKHLIYYWIFPFLVKEAPFGGKASFIGVPESGIRMRLRDVDYYSVPTEHCYKALLSGGFPAEKLYILEHPLAREKSKNFFKKPSWTELYEK